MTIEGLAQAAIALVPAQGRAILGIGGTPGAGKTTLAEAIIREVARTRGPEWVAHVPMDGFHLADVQLARLNALGRKGAPDTFDAEGYAHLLERIRTDDASWIYAPGFDRDLEQPLAAAMVVPPAARLVVTEGNYLLLEVDAWPRARAAVDAVWFVTGDEQVRLERLVQRHVDFGKGEQDARTWVAATDEPNAQLVAANSARADRHVRNGADGWAFTDE
ncbi:MAG: nucleoside/nucleotide kinase family protein [Terracoccus sp.]